MTSTDTIVASPRCPSCRSRPGEASSALAPDQVVCPDAECPVVSWRQDRVYRQTSPSSYLPAEVIRDV